MINVRVMAIVGAALLAVSCVALQKPVTVQRVAFPQEEYASLPTAGTAVVRGQAFLKTRGGDVKTAAGEEVLLNPVTSYSQQWYDVSYLGGNLLTDPDPRYVQYHRKTVADGDGRFTFRDVPAGDYFVTARVVWEAATGYQGALTAQGGFVSKRISVQDGDDLDVIVTR